MPSAPRPHSKFALIPGLVAACLAASVLILLRNRGTQDEPPEGPRLVVDNNTARLLRPSSADAAQVIRDANSGQSLQGSSGASNGSESGVAEMVSAKSLASALTQRGQIIVQAQVLLDAGLSEALADAVVTGIDRYWELYRKLSNHKNLTVQADVLFSVLPDLPHLLETKSVTIEARPGTGRRFNYWDWTNWVDGAMFHFESKGWEITLSIHKGSVDPGLWSNLGISPNAKHMPIGQIGSITHDVNSNHALPK